jgi:hypothetical protein
MRRNSRNSKKNQLDGIACDSPFSILSKDGQHEDALADSTVVSSIEPLLESRAGRPLRPSRKRQQECSPSSPGPVSKRRAQKINTPASTVTNGQILQAVERVEAALARSEERAAKAEKRVEELEATVKGLLEAQSRPTETRTGPSPTPPTTLRVNAPQYRLPGVNLDLSTAPQLRDKTPGELRKCVDDGLQACGLEIKNLGVNVKEKGKIRVFFRGGDHAIAQREIDKWVQAMVRGPGHVRVYGEQWFPVGVDRVKKSVTMGRTLFGKLNSVGVAKMRWLSKPGVGKEHGSILLFSSRRKNKLIAGCVVHLPGGEIAFPRVFETRLMPTRCFRCHEYGHTQLCCANDVVCGHCAGLGHQAENCTSLTTKCAACHGPHRATDPGCGRFKKERRVLLSYLQ